MRHEFSNSNPVPIPAANPNSIQSTIEVNGTQGGIRDVNIALDINHSWTNDLRIVLEAPSGDKILLVEREGGSGDNFRGTTFDDAASRSIVGAGAPFSGTFRPEESLGRFDGQESNGVWVLHIDDQASDDGGTLNSWSLSIEDGSAHLENSDPLIIDAGAPSTVESTIQATGLGGVVIAAVRVTVDIEHTWDQDLTLTLVAPDGTSVVLADREGGSADDFRATVFDDGADTPITSSTPPYTGSFRPEQPLVGLQEGIAEGVWTLRIEDHANQDGGTLHSWSLDIQTGSAQPRTLSEFTIELRFDGGLTPTQRSVFQLAAARWEEVIVGNLPSARVHGHLIDDVLIVAEGIHIDGPSGVLGRAGPTHTRPGSNLPARGIMEFDSADLTRMEQEGSLVDMIIHEMGHVLGIGTLWEDMKLLEGAETEDPEFNGPAAMAEYGQLRNSGGGEKVPVANTGGAGTRDGHWRETTFGNELMTGFLDTGNNPLSRLSIASVQDLGYEVNFDAADAFELPSTVFLASLRRRARHVCRTVAPKPTVLPESAVEE